MSDDKPSQPTFFGFSPEWVKTLGLPTVMLMAMTYGMYSTATWTANEVAKPLVERHIRFLDKTEELMASHERSLKKHDETLEKVSQTLEAQGRAIEALSRQINRQSPTKDGT